MLLVLPIAGCGGSGAPASLVAGSENALAAGAESLQNGDFAAAEKELTAAIERGGLQPDLLEQALLDRARARIGLQDFDGAKSDLDELEKGAAAMDQLWLVRGELLQKQGDEAGAKNAFQQARKINPKVAIPSGAK